MRYSICKCQIVAAVLFLCTTIDASTVTASTNSSNTSLSSPSPSSPPTNATCEARTINYITHRLPQQCLKSSWQHANSSTSTQTKGTAESTGSIEIVANTTNSATTRATNGSDGTQESAVNLEVPAETITVTTDLLPSPTSEDSAPTPIAAEEDPAFGDATFISFEDWKQQNLEKVGQNLEIGERRQKLGNRDRDSIHHALDSFGEEGEISLDFMGFTGHEHDEISNPGNTATGTEGSEAQKTPAVKPRSKDAGTTCKERFNYASFDAGSTIKKSNPEAKSVTKILSENKDSYMLNKCSAPNKFFIVELSDDILVDTVVLANFEFFSSQFRQFRVSVSDRYPVKLDRWVDLGTYEAQNARGIQAFLVEEPKIWARYLKIEFLTHFGKEFYCPVSLLRVHGRTMISEFRAEEEAARGEADSDEESEGSREEAGEKMIPEAVAAVVIEEQLKGAQAALAEMKTSEAIALEEASKNSKIMESDESHVPEPPITKWSKSDFQQWPFAEIDLPICSIHEPNSNFAGTVPTDAGKTTLREEETKSESPTTTPERLDAELVEISASKSDALSRATESPSLIDKLSKTVSEMKESVKTLTSSSASRSDTDATATATNNVTNKSSNTHQKPNSTTSSPPPATPSTQESFFKTVHKRLQFLEANSTLSLQYIESQSALLRDAFQKVEKRQLGKTATFLESLNETVMNELRSFRQQYDQIWQSTVIELETQRDRSEREILEVSRRMTVLADEVIFQKRMSIVQSLLLLLCLGLVLFSNRGQGAYLELPMGNFNRLRSISPGMNGDGYLSSPGSPSPTPSLGPLSPGAPDGSFVRQRMLRPDLRRAHSSWDDSSRHKRTKSYDSLEESDNMGRSSPYEESPSTPFSMYSKPLPEIGSSSPLRRSLEDMELSNGKENGYLGSVNESQRNTRNINSTDHALHAYDFNDSDPGDRGTEPNQRPGFPRTSTTIYRDMLPDANRTSNKSDGTHYYVTPPPENALAGLSQNEEENYERNDLGKSSSETEVQESGNTGKPLPALPPEIDDESDEDTTQ